MGRGIGNPFSGLGVSVIAGVKRAVQRETLSSYSPLLFTLFTYLFTIVYMNKNSTKKPRSFRFSAEVEVILEQQEDPKKFIESLITGTHVRPLEVVPLQQLKELLESMGPSAGSISSQSSETPPQFKKSPSPTANRTHHDTLQDIKKLESERSAMFSQDPDDYLEINRDIDELWKEYHALKQASQN